MKMAPPPDHLRQRVLDLARAPRGPLDLSQYTWLELAPGFKVHILEEDSASGRRSCLVWAQPGATQPRHLHHGDENVLVLQGAFRDERDTYRAGDVCYSRAGSAHRDEAVVGSEDCICFVVSYGPLEFLSD
jgi:predicted ChrR family anti-sigma factor